MESTGTGTTGHDSAYRHHWRLATSRLRCEPGFLIVGAMKAGTTFLHACLAEHPSCVCALEKEVHFFDNNYHRGRRWYRSRFPIRRWMESRRQQPVLAGEASPYYLFHPLSSQRAHETCPNARIIVLLRDPADRAYSHYQQNVRTGFEKLSFAEAIEAEPDRLHGEEDRLRADPGYYSMAHQTFSYVSRGEYGPQVARWVERFGAERVLVVQSETLWDDPAQTYARVLRFLDLAVHEPRVFRPHNRGRYLPMDGRTRAALEARFAPSNENLFALLGERFAWPKTAERVAAAAG
ncbi:Sulfotransferase [hydrothermal vent metagenome]|uniref:Sulfotransferase n=1 Tax=hydrothermal vent metagenome TaxID=652676 RepID=A0A3B1DFV5_9ZZZZ